jgi:copper homeostasis protein
MIKALLFNYHIQERKDILCRKTKAGLNMEVCVDSLESAICATEGGAIRLELCSSLAVGGTTPTLGFLYCVKQKLPNVCAHVLVRCRDGDFLFSEDEVQIMVQDVKSLVKGGADGIVIGCLDDNGYVDVKQCKKLIQASKEASEGRTINITFHRAFDMTVSTMLSRTMNDIIEIGCSRVLTSGQMKTAIEGVHVICDLIQKYQDKIIIMPGGGLNENNLELLLKSCPINRIEEPREIQAMTLCGIKEFHASARVSKDSEMKYRNEASKMGSDSQEYTMQITSSEKVRKMVELYNQYC